jgi:rhodanese-related sulfurtransferase
MKKVILALLVSSSLYFAQENSKSELTELSNYLTNYNYQEVAEMSIGIEEMLQLVKDKKAEVIDIRFVEENKTWSFGFMKSIPINELPNRINELDKEKLIVTVCPHSTRSALARHFLTLKGFRSKFLSEGLTGLAEYLRGAKAKNFYNSIK